MIERRVCANSRVREHHVTLRKREIVGNDWIIVGQLKGNIFGAYFVCIFPKLDAFGASDMVILLHKISL